MHPAHSGFGMAGYRCEKQNQARQDSKGNSYGEEPGEPWNDLQLISQPVHSTLLVWPWLPSVTPAAPAVSQVSIVETSSHGPASTTLVPHSSKVPPVNVRTTIQNPKFVIHEKTASAPRIKPFLRRSRACSRFSRTRLCVRARRSAGKTGCGSSRSPFA